MKNKNFIASILDVLTVISFLILFSSAGLRDNRTSGWYQQWFPNLNGSTITSMTFLDSLTGFAVTNSNSLLQQYILETTNGGDNWFINFTFNTPNSNWSFLKIKFTDSVTGFAFSWSEMFKTTNGGSNWDLITNNLYPEDVAIINKDTILAVSSSGFDGGVYRTTNGGLNWHALGPTGGSGQPSSIYMFDKNMGFCLGNQMRKTTNGGVNWFVIPNESYTSIKFIDSLIGWKVSDSLKKTTNGGLNWFTQRTPNISHNFWSSSEFSILNKDTIWMVGAISYIHAPIYKTTNGGINWGYQYPDTTDSGGIYSFISFINNKIGWAKNRVVLFEIHTISGGNDTTFITSVNNNSAGILAKYILFQNYPNPFNQSTIINYQCSIKCNAELRVFDITGREIRIILKEQLQPGHHKILFSAGELPSGIYFYTLFADGVRIDTKKMVVLK
jgi:photosystem II stability/assembly factor-like uncharacterized protein